MVILETGAGRHLVLSEEAAWWALATVEEPLRLVTGTLTRRGWERLWAEADRRRCAEVARSLRRAQERGDEPPRPPAVIEARLHLERVAQAKARWTRMQSGRAVGLNP